MTDDVEAAIAAYRAELTAEAELARGDLEEIEDHLRSLIDELRQARPLDAAIVEARARLGDPRRLAREHARVRTPFGARLSRARSWGAAALMVPPLVLSIPSLAHFGIASPVGIHISVMTLVFAALIARTSWARPIVTGVLATALVSKAAFLVGTSEHFPGGGLDLVRVAVALALVAPWRRGELTAAGHGLALLALPLAAALDSTAFFSMAPEGMMRATPFGAVAFAAVIVAIAGFITRARWSAVAAAITAVALVGAATTLSLIVIVPDGGTEWQRVALGLHAAGAVAAAASAVLGWRTARSTLGSLRGIVG